VTACPKVRLKREIELLRSSSPKSGVVQLHLSRNVRPPCWQEGLSSHDEENSGPTV